MSHRPSKLEDLAGPPTEEELNCLQLTTLQYYLHETNPANGLVRDKTAPKAPCSIAAVGIFKASFNQTYAVPDSPTGWWVTPYHFGIDQGPVVLMIENYRTGLIWDLMRRSPYVRVGLRRAGFQGGWL
jgi:hypothetical protein